MSCSQGFEPAGLLFSYNILNLPCEVTAAAGAGGGTSGSLTYTYLSDGTKVSAITSDGSGKRYVGSMVYSVPSSGNGSETLESAAWDEGRIFFDVEEPVDSTGNGLVVVDSIPGVGCYRDCWYVTDHLGNVRSVVDISASLAAPQVVERNDYLPYGTRLGVGNAVLESNHYRLGGKEEQTFGSLDLGKVDFGARQYDPFTARWTTIDPLAAKYVSMSPYSYCAGNPVNIVDPQGDSLILNTYGRILSDEGPNNRVYYKNGEDLVYIGELGGIIDASFVFDNLLSINMEFAETINNIFNFVHLIKPGGVWDYKNRLTTIWGRANYTRNTKFLFHGVLMEPDDIGNFHFGVVTKAYGKIPEEMGLIGAGLVQILSGTSSMRFINCTYTRFPMGVGGQLEIKRPYGDDPKDQEQILRGYEYYKKKQ